MEFKMFNLYTNAIDHNGFLGLVSNFKTTDKQFETDSSTVVSDFAAISLVIIYLISGGSVYQTNNDIQKLSTIASYTSVI